MVTESESESEDTEFSGRESVEEGDEEEQAENVSLIAEEE